MKGSADTQFHNQGSDYLAMDTNSRDAKSDSNELNSVSDKLPADGSGYLFMNSSKTNQNAKLETIF